MNPCEFSPGDRDAALLAEFFSTMFERGARVLDLGSGQGHFLEAARNRGVVARGIEINGVLVDACRGRGLDVVQGDVRELASLESSVFDGVFASHLVEHLDANELSNVLAQIAARVRVGGMLVIVTPNFKDLRVSGEWFWLDPTHVRPYPPRALAALAVPSGWSLVAQGFTPTRLTRSRIAVMLNRVRYGRDYGHAGIWVRFQRT